MNEHAFTGDRRVVYIRSPVRVVVIVVLSLCCCVLYIY